MLRIDYNTELLKFCLCFGGFSKKKDVCYIELGFIGLIESRERCPTIVHYSPLNPNLNFRPLWATLKRMILSEYTHYIIMKVSCRSAVRRISAPKYRSIWVVCNLTPRIMHHFSAITAKNPQKTEQEETYLQQSFMFIPQKG